MRERNRTIAHTLISEEEIRSKLPSIFTDSIILDAGFRMVVVSNNILDLLEFRSTELNRKDINYITGSFNFIDFLTTALKPGFFQERYIELFSKSNKPILTAISGFYLGLISDINGYIILKIHNAQSLQAVNKELESKRIEIDNFIYRTAHDLRGPLATIRGLINLYQLKKDEFDIDHLIRLINNNASLLDEKLFKLLYLAEADQSFNDPSFVLDIKAMEIYLRKKIESNSLECFLNFQLHTSLDQISGVNEVLTFSLIGNITDLLLNLPKSSVQDIKLIFFLSLVDEVVEIKILVKGFEINEETRNMIRHIETFYGDVLTHPELFNYFAALKIALRLKAIINMNLTNQLDHEIMISISRGNPEIQHT